MALALREDLFFCLTDRCAIVLDLAANRYFGLTGTAHLALRRIIAGDALDPELENALRPLLATGLLSTVAEAQPLAPVTNPAPEESLDTGDTPAGTRTTVIALGLYARVLAEMRISGLNAMVRRRALRKAGQPACAGRSVPLDGVRQLVAAHRRVDQLAGAVDRCLARSLALVDHLALRGIYPEMVVGIRTGAFSAHCWVQLGPLLLNDEMDRVRVFTPILVL
jgi:hypothetical protein